MLAVRHAWSDLDSIEKAAIVLGLVALTLAAWVLGSAMIP